MAESIEYASPKAYFMIASAPALSSQYDPASTEAKWQEIWESKGVFTADPNHGGEPYCVVIPPPNVT
ncbi:MAG: hypothetical protein AAF329_19505, partial [Cyanobacteria bacterium P01_A01_bin.17]